MSEEQDKITPGTFIKDNTWGTKYEILKVTPDGVTLGMGAFTPTVPHKKFRQLLETGDIETEVLLGKMVLDGYGNKFKIIGTKNTARGLRLLLENTHTGHVHYKFQSDVREIDKEVKVKIALTFICTYPHSSTSTDEQLVEDAKAYVLADKNAKECYDTICGEVM